MGSLLQERKEDFWDFSVLFNVFSGKASLEEEDDRGVSREWKEPPLFATLTAEHQLNMLSRPNQDATSGFQRSYASVILRNSSMDVQC